MVWIGVLGSKTEIGREFIDETWDIFNLENSENGNSSDFGLLVGINRVDTKIMTYRLKA